MAAPFVIPMLNSVDFIADDYTSYEKLSTANISTLFETANKKGENFSVVDFVVRTNNIFGGKSCGVFADLLHLQCN